MSMSKKDVRKLDLGELGNLRSGLVGKQFEEALRKCLADCVDRPGNNAARKIGLVIEIKPAYDDATECDKVDISVIVRDRVPDFHINAHQARVRKMRDKGTGKELYVASVGGDPEDVDQAMLGDV